MFIQGLPDISEQAERAAALQLQLPKETARPGDTWTVSHPSGPDGGL